MWRCLVKHGKLGIITNEISDTIYQPHAMDMADMNGSDLGFFGPAIGGQQSLPINSCLHGYVSTVHRNHPRLVETKQFGGSQFEQ